MHCTVHRLDLHSKACTSPNYNLPAMVEMYDNLNILTYIYQYNVATFKQSNSNAGKWFLVISFSSSIIPFLFNLILQNFKLKIQLTQKYNNKKGTALKYQSLGYPIHVSK